ncbi:MAG: GAF domain-containing protein [Anaerolineae bacterium]|nr:GAF domain-containing protein [Anaerolineae bacterium]
MFRRSRTLFFSWSLGLLTLGALLVTMPDIGAFDPALWLFFAGLVGLTLNLGTALTEGIVSPAPTAALMAYLTMGKSELAPAALWSVAAGSLVGYVVWFARVRWAGRFPGNFWQLWGGVTTRTAQLTLGVFVGGWFYRQLNGRLPLIRLDNSDIAPLAGLMTAYMLVYLAVLLLEVQLHRQRVLRVMTRHWQVLAGDLLAPLPFAALGAVVYHQLPSPVFGMLIAGLLLVLLIIHLSNQTLQQHRQQVLELSSRSTVSQDMITKLDLNTLLGGAYQQVKHLMGVNNFTVALLEPARNMLHFPVNIRDDQPARLQPRRLDQGLIEHVIREKTELLITDHVAQRARAMGLTPPRGPVDSWLGVPMMVSGRVLGCMVIYSSQSNQHFTPDDLHLLTTIAGQTSIAIDNTQRYKEAHDRSIQLGTLNHIATTLGGTLDIQQMLDLVGSSAISISGCDGLALYLWWGGNTNQPLSLVRHSGLSDVFVAAPPRPLLLNEQNLQHQRQPIIVTDASIDNRTKYIRSQMMRENKHAWVELLLCKGGDLLGVMTFLYNNPRSFNAVEVELLRNFADQAAQAINNASLYTQTDRALNRRVKQLSALADISRELTSTLTLQGLFQLVLDRALEITRSRTGALLLRTGSGNLLPSLVAYRGFAPDAFDQISPMVGLIKYTYQTGRPTLIPDVSKEKDYVPLDQETRAQLNVPIMRGEDVLGVISLGSDQINAYDPDDLMFVTQLAIQAHIAIDNVRLLRRIEVDRDRLQVILDSMTEGVILIGPQSWIALANPRVERLLGLDVQQIIDHPVDTLLRNPSLELAERLGFSGPEAMLDMLQTLDGGGWEKAAHDDDRVTYLVHVPQRRFIDRTIAPVRNDAGHVIGLLMVFTDVTRERELAQARNDLSNMIVHDLRGPLTAITASLKLLGEIAPPDEALGKSIKRTTDTSARAVRKLMNLVDSLLDISKMESGMIALDRELAPLPPLCSNVLDELFYVAQELEIELTANVPPDLPLLDIDTDKVERILLNLMDNAIKFTPSKGQVALYAYSPKTAKTEPGFVRVEVHDTGPGIPDDDKERLFERYTQLEGVRGRRRGTGLGLTFCHLAVEAHGGRIWVEDRSGGGSIFVFTLPIADLEQLEAFNLETEQEA